MDELITRIVEIERQCAAVIEKAEAASAGRIAEHKRVCEAKKEEERKRILSSENARRTQTLNDAKQQIQNETADFLQGSERLFADPGLQTRIKEEILNILLEA